MTPVWLAKNGGTGKTLAATGTVQDGHSGNNYAVTFVTDTTGVITAETLTGYFTAGNKVYDGATAATITGRTLSALETGDLVTLTGGTATFADKNVGTAKTVTGTSFTLTGAQAGNYQLASTTLTTTANITPRAVLVTVNPTSKVYGDADPPLTYTASPALVSGDGFSGALTRVSGENAGTYAIQQGTLSAGSNYTITYAGALLTITARPITIKAVDQTKIYGNTFTFSGTEITILAPSSLAPTDTVTVTLTSNGAAVGATVAGSPYAITPSAAVFLSGPATNYSITYQNGSLAVTPRDANAAYIGQTVFTTSGSSSTTAQVTLTASVADPNGAGSIANATVTFTDTTAGAGGKVLASGEKVSPVSNSDTHTGTANTVVALSSGQYGAQEYLIEVTVGGSYRNTQQTTAPPNTDPWKATHADVTVMVPHTAYSMQGTGNLTKLATAAGQYGDASSAHYTVGMKYNSKGTSPQGQVQLVLTRADGTYYIKSNSITSLAFATANSGQPSKDVTIYTKASIYKIVNGSLISIDGGVTLRVDAHEGCATSPNCTGTTDDTIGFTVLSGKDSSLYYSNNWAYASDTLSWRTIQQSVTGATGVVIN